MVIELTALAFTLAVMTAALVLSEGTQVSRLMPLIGGSAAAHPCSGDFVGQRFVIAIGRWRSLIAGLWRRAARWRARRCRTLAAWGSASAGVVIPLLLAVLSPALESLLATSRPVLASATIAILTSGAVLLRLVGSTVVGAGAAQSSDLRSLIVYSAGDRADHRRAAARVQSNRGAGRSQSPARKSASCNSVSARAMPIEATLRQRPLRCLSTVSSLFLVGAS